MTITVFTPSYNRAYILPKLYESLQQQTCKDFEWLIVDDGSTDNTEELVAPWLSEKDFPIRYVKQENGGKHVAINRGVVEAQGELFFIVDSDDSLTLDAIEDLKKYFSRVKEDNNIAGVIGMRICPDGKRIGGDAHFEEMVCSRYEFRYKHKYGGDLAEAYRTDILKKYPFPVLEGEKFCPESIVWLKIANEYSLFFFNKGIYVCEYLPDGLTHHVDIIRIKSPRSAMINYAIEYNCPVPLRIKVKDAINYWRFRFHYHNKIKEKKIAIWAMPIGWFFYRLDCVKYPDICGR